MTSVDPDLAAVERAHTTLSEARSGIEDASFELLMSKPRRQTSFLVHVPAGEDGETRPVKVRYRALSPKEYDELVAAHPPTAKQKAEGSTWNVDTFPAALIAAVSHTPKLTPEQAKALYANENWAPGEQRALFYEAMDVCAQGLNVPFSAGV